MQPRNPIAGPPNLLGPIDRDPVAILARGDRTRVPAPLFLQVKEAGKSVLECLGPKFDGLVKGQHIMQAASDVFLGWTQDEASGRHFYVRQLKNRRLGSIGELVEENALVNYARLCGRTLARAHARSADPVVLAGYMGKSDAFDDALASFAMAYAVRTQKDYDQLAKSKRKAA